MSDFDLSFLQGLPTHLPNQEPTAQPQQEEIKVDVSSRRHQDASDCDFSNHEQAGKENKAGGAGSGEAGHAPKTKKKAVRIPGTNITLETDEDIARWIAERKKNWPSSANIQRKKEVLEARKMKMPKSEKPAERERGTQQTKRPADDGDGDGDGAGADANGETQPQSKRSKNICRFYMQYGKCKFGDKCKNVHEKPADDPNPIAGAQQKYSTTHSRRFINGVNVLIPKLYSNRTENTPSAKSSLFKHMISHDQMVHENTIVIDFVRYLEEKGLIDHEVMMKRLQ
ncbi:uncharacterized protein LODBEIA_P22860 [Lodderomyces beijingensis]|uniref:C3H1-type domain-containing protein n=1 Tax=Lodderomyces beijingensis TaxID=1775926 RepID=A0ABP0ZL09_9ASCO